MTIERIKISLTIMGALTALLAVPYVSHGLAGKTYLDKWETTLDNYALSAVSSDHHLAEKLAAIYIKLEKTPNWQPDLAVTVHQPKLDYDSVKTAMNRHRQQDCLAEAIYYEARSEDLSGQKAVAEVVLNRVASHHFPNNICSVVYEGAERDTGCQFSFTCDGSTEILPKGKSWERSKKLANHLMLGFHNNMTSRSTHYHTTDIYPHWADNLLPTQTIGSHKFYKFKNRRQIAMLQDVAP